MSVKNVRGEVSYQEPTSMVLLYMVFLPLHVTPCPYIFKHEAQQTRMMRRFVEANLPLFLLKDRSGRLNRDHRCYNLSS